MNPWQRRSLALCSIDVEGALRRLAGDEGLYFACLRAFLEDGTVEALALAIQARAWDDAFTAAHALKGLAGNLGLVPLMHAAGQVVVLIRDGHTRELREVMGTVRRRYRDTVEGIGQALALSDEEHIEGGTRVYEEG